MALEDEIAELEGILNAGANRLTTDGLTVSYDLEKIRRRLAELKERQEAGTRPRAAAIDLSGF